MGEYQVVNLNKEDAKDVSALFKEVWSKAYDYPEEWREKRAMSEEEVKKEMESGYFFFGVHMKGKGKSRVPIKFLFKFKHIDDV